jgi:hypothetical protein
LELGDGPLPLAIGVAPGEARVPQFVVTCPREFGG